MGALTMFSEQHKALLFSILLQDWSFVRSYIIEPVWAFTTWCWYLTLNSWEIYKASKLWNFLKLQADWLSWNLILCIPLMLHKLYSSASAPFLIVYWFSDFFMTQIAGICLSFKHQQFLSLLYHLLKSIYIAMFNSCWILWKCVLFAYLSF